MDRKGPERMSVWELMLVGLSNAVATALFVGGVAAVVVKRFEGRQAEHRQSLQNDYDKSQKTLEAQHSDLQQRREQEFQTRDSLRASYAELLIVQRRSRQASLRLAATPVEDRIELEREAGRAHDAFIDQYHRLALDADKEMWFDARSLRDILDDLLAAARTTPHTEATAKKCAALATYARHARQNLERSFRLRLGHQPLQDRKDVGRYLKGPADRAGDEAAGAVS